MSEIPVNQPLPKKKVGRPVGSTKERCSIKHRLGILKNIMNSGKTEDRVRLAAVDLYTKIAGDALKPTSSTLSGSVLGFEFTNTTSPTITTPLNAPQTSMNAPLKSSTAPITPITNAVSNVITAPVTTPNESNNNLIIPHSNDSNESGVEKKESVLEEICREVSNVDFGFKEEEDLFGKLVSKDVK